MENEAETITLKGAPMAIGNEEVKITNVPLKKIKLSRNSRMNIDPEELSGLMQSIKEEGLLQPIGLMKNGSGDHYEICYGNRRFLAVSKLGLHKIPAIIHNKKKESDIDIKNLTENIQRRNISLQEAGRYIELLKKNGLTADECAVRLGVTPNYVQSCLQAYNDVPKEFREDLEIRVVNGKVKNTRVTPGKISIKTARTIINAEKSGLLTKGGMKKLFRAAKSDDRFSPELVPQYAAAIKKGKDDFLETHSPLRRIVLSVFVTEKEYDKLHKEHVENGPFQSVNKLFIAILRGEKNVKVNVK